MRTSSHMIQFIRNSSVVLALTGTALLALQFQANAQVKGGQRLIQIGQPSVSKATGPGVATSMSCGDCKDVWEIRADADAKGGKALLAGGVATKKIVSHQCGGGNSKWEVTGQGKAKQTVAVHSCARQGTATLACCEARTSGAAR